MKILTPSKYLIRKLAPALLAVSSVAACTTAPATPTTGFDAGGPSSHVAERYETTSSTAASTSTLGGSVVKISFASAVSGADWSVSAVSGSITHDTGRIELNDGTFLFVDADGADAFDEYDNGSGATGNIPATFTGTYQYVMPYTLSYAVSTTTYVTSGIAGMVTATTDMPSGGSASYAGEANVIVRPLTAAGANFGFTGGTSTVAVDFAAGTANVTLASFANITDAAGAVTPTAAPFDTVQGNGLVISGAQFTGGNWVTVKGGVVVNITGANATAISSGTFFGYDPSISAPDEVGGVFVIEGGSAVVTGSYIAD